MRILRTIALLAAAGVFLPSPPQDRFATGAEDPPATQYLAAAVSTLADMRDFCGRQPSVCDTAHYLAAKLEGKAEYTIELIYEWSHDPQGAAQPEFASGGSSDDGAGQSTLRLEDLIPEWRAPRSRKG